MDQPPVTFTVSDLLKVLGIALVFLFPAGSPHAQTGTVDTDKAALTALYNATDGTNWTTATNWNSDDLLSTWHGVATDSDGRVSELDLNGNGLTGALPSELGDLDRLEHLDLGDNGLSGALPTEVADLTSLATLRLNAAWVLVGALPDGLRELTALSIVDIQDTELCAPDDADFKTWLDSITFSGLICPPPAPSVIDVAVFYTPAARHFAGGAAAIEDQIDLMVAETNLAFSNSRVNQSVSLVAVEELVHEEFRLYSIDLFEITIGFAHLYEAHRVRNRLAADIVVLLRRDQLEAAISSANVMESVSENFAASAFAIVDIRGNVRHFAHELGHVMGLRHDRYNACEGGDCDKASFPYAFGYVNQRAFEVDASASARWGTIMAYEHQCYDANLSCTFLSYFSNPEIAYGGDSMGVAGLAPSSAIDGPSDAARTLNRTRGYVANFRQSPGITASFGAAAYTATEGGAAATVTVELSAEPTRPVVIPMTLTSADAAPDYDYERTYLSFDTAPSWVFFEADETEQSFTVTATDDAIDEDDETIVLSLGAPLPRGVTGADPNQTTVTLADNDPDPGVPGVHSVELTSEPDAAKTYLTGDEIEASVRFTKTVAVTGMPYLALTIGTEDREAQYRTRAGEVLRFVYTVTAFDADTDGVAIAADALNPNGGTIQDGDGNSATVTHAAVSDDDEHRVGAAPAVESMTSSAAHPTKDPFTVTIAFSDSLTGLTADEVKISNGTASNFSGSGATYSVRVTPDADFEGDVRVRVPGGAAEDASATTNSAGTGFFAVDTRAPGLATTDGATVKGENLRLRFDEDLQSSSTPTSAFSVTSAITRAVTGVAVEGSRAYLSIDPPALHGEAGIAVNYSAPSSDALTDVVGNPAPSLTGQAVANQTPGTTLSTVVRLTMNEAEVAEAGPAKTVTVTGRLNGAARPSATTVAIEVGAGTDTATEGTDYTTVDDLTLTIPAYSASGTVSFTLTPTNDRIDEVGESLTVSGSTSAAGLTVTPPGGLALDIADNDAAPTLVLSVSASTIDEDGGTATATVSTGSGSTFATDQTVRLAVAGTATETADYTISGTTLTLPAGVGTSASMVSATVTGMDDSLDDDDEAIEITGARNGVAFGSRQTIAIVDDDWPELTVTFRQADYRVAEGGQVDLPVTLSAVPERQVTISIDIEGVDGAESVDYSVSPSSLSFGANERTKTVRVSASNDSVVDPGESVTLSFGTSLPERISEGGIAQTAVAIRDTDFTFTPAFAAGSGTTESDTDTFTVSENSSALRLSLSLETPRGARVVDIVDPVVVALETRENAGSKGMDEDYATQRRSGTFGDYGEFDRDLSFAPGDFSDDITCGCARAEKAVSVDLFNDRVHERVEVFGLRLSRTSGRLGVASKDITAKIAEDDAEPVLTLEASPGSIAEAGGTSTVTVSTGTGSTFPTAQTIDLDLSGTATQGTDYTIDATALTLPAGVGQDPSSVTTTVRATDDPIDDDGETIVVSATRGGVEFANRTVTVTDDEVGSTRVDLAVNPAQVREDAGTTPVRVTASLNADARGQDTEVAVTIGAGGDSAVEGTDYGTVRDLTLTIDAGETTAETTFTLDPTNNNAVDGTKTITVDGSAAGLAVRSADLTLNDDDVASTTVTLTLDLLEVSESVGSRTVRVTGTLDGGTRAEDTEVRLTVGAAGDTAVPGTDYERVPELDLTIPADRTDGTVTFTLRPTNDATAEGQETISVSGDTAGLTVVPAELVLADNDAVSTRLSLSLRPSSVSEGAAPTDVTVTGTLDAGARETETLVTLTVGAPADSAVSDTDYAAVSNGTLAIPANETRAETTFKLTPEDDAIAEGAETISISGRTNGLTVEPAILTLSDNDTASRAVTLTVDPESVSEDMPEDVTVTASLNAGARAEDTEVRLTVGAAGDTAVPGTDYERVPERTLTIRAGETSGMAAFRLEPFNNGSTDGARTLSVRGSTTVAELRIEPASGARIALDDDDIPGVRVAPDTLTVVEAESDIYTVALQTRPTADVTVTIGGVSGDLSLDKRSLVFTQADWGDPQDVEVSAADDDDSMQDPDVTLTHRASGAAEYRGLRSDLVVSIRENDPSLVFSDSSLTVPEGETATYTVALATLPTANVTVRVTGVSGDLSLDRTQLVFTRGNWNNAQPVIVEAAEDDDTSTDPAVTLTHTATGGGYDGIVGELRVSVTEKDGGGGTGGGGGGGGAANRPPVVEREIEDQTLDVGEVLELDIRLNFYDRDQRALDYTAESADPAVATAEVDRNGLVTIRGIKRGVTAVTVTAADRRDAQASDTFAVTVRGPAFVALFPRAADPVREGFARVINHDMEAGEVSIEAIDDSGSGHGPITLSIKAGETVHFNSGDLEDGNAAKGLPEGVGSGEGDWRLVLSSELDFEALSYIRTQDGFLTAMHDTVPVRDGAYEVAIFNPGSNTHQVSRLRLINPGGAAAEVTVTGVDDAGASPGTSVELEIPAGESLTLTASDLEAGAGVDGALGDGAGKWRLRVMSTEPIVAMSLLSSPTGHLTNLSPVPTTPGAEHGTQVVPLFPSASDPLGRQGFVRVVNRSTEAGTVQIAATDDSALAYGDVTLSIGAGATVHFNSNDLELGNAAKGLSGSTGAGVGDWRLVLSSEMDIRVLAYIRTTDGFLTSMHEVAPRLEGIHRVAIFNPGSNPHQVSRLRLVNPGSEDAEVKITGVDDAGVSPGSAVVLTVPAGGSRTIRAAELESGGEGLSGALGDGVGKWRLQVESDEPIVVMSLLSSPTGHLTNLSTAPGGRSGYSLGEEGNP